MRIILALRVFFLILVNAKLAGEVRQLLQPPAPTQESPAPKASPAQPSSAAVPRSGRSDALTLLATLQRESRLVDLVSESLEQYSDAQIGAAARDVLRDCGKTLTRLFDLEPVVSEPEGAEIEVPAGFDADRYRVTGNTSGTPPFRGRVVHHGWRANTCQLPSWNGRRDSANIIAAAEVDVR